VKLNKTIAKFIVKPFCLIFILSSLASIIYFTITLQEIKEITIPKIIFFLIIMWIISMCSKETIKKEQ